MSNKYKPWQNSERRAPKKFRKFSAGEGGDYYSGGRSHKERRKNERQDWKRQSWDQEP